MAAPSMHLAAALDGTGWHPASWRDAASDPGGLLRPQLWARQALTAERGLLDLITIEDAFGLQTARRGVPDERVDQVRGRLDATVIAAFVAPLTSHLGIVPTATPTLSEPFHLASIFATLDHISHGRAGWRPQVSTRRDEAALLGRRAVPQGDPLDRTDPAVAAFVADVFEEATDAVEVARRLWDSWEDDAIIKDVATGRFVDRDKLHYIDFSGRFFSVKGPSIVPRPPQGNPLVVALAHQRLPFEFAARAADVVFVTPADRDDVPRWIGGVRRAEADVGRTDPPLRILADLVVFLAATHDGAVQRKVQLDGWDGRPYRSDAQVFVGTPQELAVLLRSWHEQGLDGFRLRPGVTAVDLELIVDGVVPALQTAGVFRRAAPDGTLRQRFGLERRPSRYASAGREDGTAAPLGATR